MVKNRLYLHHKGGKYVFICLSKDKQGNPTVIYRAYAKVDKYERLASEFFGNVTVGGKTVKRFKEIKK